MGFTVFLTFCRRCCKGGLLLYGEKGGRGEGRIFYFHIRISSVKRKKRGKGATRVYWGWEKRGGEEWSRCLLINGPSGGGEGGGVGIGGEKGGKW